MFRVDCYEFYKLANQLHPLTTLPDSAALNDVWATLYTAKRELDTFFRTFDLRTSRNPARELYMALQEVIPDDFSQVAFANSDGTPRLLLFEIGNIKRLVVEFEAVMRAELNGWDIFFVSKKGRFDTSDLINTAENILPVKVQAYLSNDAREDVRLAGRSLAFNMGTAAAFHMIRATETFIWKYYESVIGEIPAVKMRNWGAYAKNLRKCSKADTAVIGWIERIKDQYRNPVLHPDQTVAPDDALEFIYACIGLMSSITTAMPLTAEAGQLEAGGPPVA